MLDIDNVADDDSKLIAAYSQRASVASEFGSVQRPSNLMLQKKQSVSGDSKHNSPMPDNTTVREYSMTNDLQQKSDLLINFDSSNDSKATSNIDLTTFDPLLLKDPQGGSIGNVSPINYSTSSSMRRQTPPRSPSIKDLQQVKSSPIPPPQPRPQPHHKSDMSPSDPVKSLAEGGTTVDNDLGDHDSGYAKCDSLSAYSSSFEIKNSPILRPWTRCRWRRLYGMSCEPVPISYQPFSPLQPNHKSDKSPSVPLQSPIIGDTTGDSDFGDCDSDSSSTYDNLIDLRDDDLEDPLPHCKNGWLF